jgi:hypothetical protein
MYRLFIKYTQALDRSDRRKLQQKVELMLDKENPPVAVITNIVDCSIGMCDGMTLTDIMQTNTIIQYIQLVLSCST